MVKDVLVQDNDQICPVDFYILNMEDDTSLNPTLILLERLFLKTTRIKIDVHDNTFTMEFNGEIVKFNIFETIR